MDTDVQSRPDRIDALAADIDAIARIDVVPKILEVICRTTGLGFAAVARVTPERWVACAVRDEIAFGLEPGGELKVETTICDEIRDTGVPVIIDHVSEDEAFREHPTPKMYGFESYISVPIRFNGQMFGTLCAIDPRPARLRTPETQAMFELFADLIASHLDVQNRLIVNEAALLDAREAAELREQFIAVLGHDLRNPLASIAGGMRLLQKTPLDERAQALTGMMQTSVRRMAGLIDNVLDFARGRLGGGFLVEQRHTADLSVLLEDIAAELRTAQPDRVIETDIVLTQPVSCDPARVAQLCSNLLANALTHGSDAEPVRVKARAENGAFTLSVTNAGPPIPAETQARLFQPFVRATVQPNKQGLGLGLHIATEIARAHDGALRVSSDETETCFTFQMPLT